jgi:hypothetical protein
MHSAIPQNRSHSSEQEPFLRTGAIPPNRSHSSIIIYKGIRVYRVFVDFRV